MPERRAVFSTHFLADLGYWVRPDRKVALRPGAFGGAGPPSIQPIEAARTPID